MPNLSEVPSGVGELAIQLAQLKPMRRGSLSERYVKCSKPGCRCAERAEARHGPYYSLTRAVGGRTQSRLVSPPQAEVVRRQVEAGRQFREQVDAVWEACEQWADAELEPGEQAAEAAEKKGFRRRSKPRSRAKSRRS